VRRWMDRFRLRIRSLVRREEVERELDRELQYHLASQVEENVAAGMTPAEARDAAARSFGPAARIGEECRDARRITWIEHLVQDVTYAGRLLTRTPAFTAAALATLTLGFGANAAILAVVHGVLLRPLPFPDPDRLVLVREVIGEGPASVTAPDYLDWLGQARSFVALGARTEAFVSLSEGNAVAEPERVEGTRASAGYFRVLDIRPAVGRLFDEQDDKEGAERVAILSDALWQRRFGSDPHIVGRSIRLDAVPHTIVGVLPPDAAVFERSDQIYVPLALTAAERESTGMHFLQVIARLHSDRSMESAQHEMVAIMKGIERGRPNSNAGVSAAVTPLSTTLVGDVRLSLGLLWGAVGLVLLIACANVANLHLSRNAARSRELSLRLSLGATRGRIVRQLLAEHLALGLAGALLGAAFASVLFDLLIQVLPSDIPRIAQARLDSTILLLTLALGALTSLAFGLVPALQMSRPDLQNALKDGGRSLAAPSRSIFASALVVGEVALAIVLLTGAGLLVRSFVRMQNIPAGFDPDGILTARLSLPAERYQNPADVVRFYDTLLDRLRAVPGVSSAAATTQLPLDAANGSMVAFIEGRPRPREGDWANWPFFFDRGVTSDYRASLGLRLIDGRDLSPADATGELRAALINETAARRYWPGKTAVGARLQPDDGDDRLVEIVGVISDTRHFGLTQEPQPEFYLPISQVSPFVWRITDRSLTMVLRSEGRDPVALIAPLRTIVRQLDPELPVYAVRSMEEVVADSTTAPRNFSALLSAFSAIALILASVGVYGLVTFLAQQRNHEFGVRMALGASASGIRRLVVGRGLVLAGSGVAIGTVAALAGSRLLQTLLFQVSAVDPLVMVSAAMLLLGVAAAACWIPARRAARVNPMLLLRDA
jgi:predicted permease